MNSEEFMRVVSIAMSDQTILPVHLTFADAWILVSALQLATRHPDIHEPLRDRLTDIAKTFQAAIEDVHPEATQLLNMGWDPTYDGMEDEEIDELDFDDETY